MLEELDDEEIGGALERGELDVGFVLLPVGDAPLETIELLRDPYVLVVAAGSPLAATGRRRSRELAARAADRLPRPVRSTEPVEAAFRAAGLEPRFALPLERQPDRAGPRRRGRRRARSCRGSPSTRPIRAIVAVELGGRCRAAR